MSRQRKAVRIRSGPPPEELTATDNSRLWLTRAALGLAGLALVGITAFLLGHQQGADSVIGALQSKGIQTVPNQPDTNPPGEQDQVPVDEAPVEDGTNEQAPAEQEKPASPDSGVEAVDAEDSGTDEDSGAVEVSGTLSVGVPSDVAPDAPVAVHVSATMPVSDSSAAEAPSEPVGSPEPDAPVMSVDTETTQPETARLEQELAELATQRQVAAAPEARSELYAQTEPAELRAAPPVAEPRLHSVDPKQVAPQSGTAVPGRVEPQEIGTNTVSTIGANEVVLVAGG
ncbi:hypothetical protein ABZ345_07160 [Lentzea sp. NPDC005914]|uniref:hypothetical protein n=1 Tax=Lentzea sp. NPDC005914 TaxID=3154572 RepID=UPI0033F4B883